MREEQKRLCFKIDVEWLTAFIRRLYNEEQVSKAYTLFAETFDIPASSKRKVFEDVIAGKVNIIESENNTFEFIDATQPRRIKRVKAIINKKPRFNAQGYLNF